jgi:hypothetical protein
MYQRDTPLPSAQVLTHRLSKAVTFDRRGAFQPSSNSIVVLLSSLALTHGQGSITLHQTSQSNERAIAEQPVADSPQPRREGRLGHLLADLRRVVPTVISLCCAR